MKITKKTVNLLVISIYIITLLLGVNTFFNISFIDKIRSFLMYFLPSCICFFILFDNKRNLKLLFKNKIPLILYLLTTLWFIFSIIFGIKVGFESVKGFIFFQIIITFLILLFNSTFKEEQILKIKKAIFISFAICMLYGIIQYVFKMNLNTYNNDKYPGILGRINSTFYIATVLDKYIVIMFPIITYELLKNKNNWFYRTLLVLSMFGITFTFSRSGQLIYLVMCFIFFVVTLFKKQFLNSILIVMLVVIMVLIPGAKYSVQSALNYAYDKVHLPKAIQLNLLDILGSDLKEDLGVGNCVDEDCVGDEEGSLFFRNYYEKVGMQFLKEHPVFGIGIGNNSYLYNNQNAKDYLRDASVLSNDYGYMYPHSGYIQLSEETGYVGITLFILTFLSLAYIKVKNNFKNNKLCLYVILLLLFGIGIGNVTEGLFHTKQVICLFTIIYSLYCNLGSDKSNDKIKSTK